MAEIKIIYGSTTGCTESAAQAVAAALGAGTVCSIAAAEAADFEADLLILGSSTWGIGELQDDWIGGIDKLDSIDLTGKKVALFGLGDQDGFGDSFCDALGIIAEKVSGRGAVIVGRTSTEGYRHSGSAAVSDGMFCGLALDENNQPELTASRIEKWVAQLKQEI